MNVDQQQDQERCTNSDKFFNEVFGDFFEKNEHMSEETFFSIVNKMMDDKSCFIDNQSDLDNFQLLHSQIQKTTEGLISQQNLKAAIVWLLKQHENPTQIETDHVDNNLNIFAFFERHSIKIDKLGDCSVLDLNYFKRQDMQDMAEDSFQAWTKIQDLTQDFDERYITRYKLKQFLFSPQKSDHELYSFIVEGGFQDQQSLHQEQFFFDEDACNSCLEQIQNVQVEDSAAKTLLNVVTLLVNLEAHQFLRDDYLLNVFRKLHILAQKTSTQENDHQQVESVNLKELQLESDELHKHNQFLQPFHNKFIEREQEIEILNKEIDQLQYRLVNLTEEYQRKSLDFERELQSEKDRYGKATRLIEDQDQELFQLKDILNLQLIQGQNLVSDEYSEDLNHETISYEDSPSPTKNQQFIAQDRYKISGDSKYDVFLKAISEPTKQPNLFDSENKLKQQLLSIFQKYRQWKYRACSNEKLQAADQQNLLRILQQNQEYKAKIEDLLNTGLQVQNRVDFQQKEITQLLMVNTRLEHQNKLITETYPTEYADTGENIQNSVSMLNYSVQEPRNSLQNFSIMELLGGSHITEYKQADGPLSPANFSQLNRSRFFGTGQPKEILQKSHVQKKPISQNSEEKSQVFYNSDEDDCSIRVESQVEQVENQTSGLGYKELFSINMPQINTIQEKTVYIEEQSQEFSGERKDQGQSTRKQADSQNEFDIIKVCDFENQYHQTVLLLVQKFGQPTYQETFEITEHLAIQKAKQSQKNKYIQVEVIKNHLNSDQAFVFSDEIKICQDDIVFECYGVIFDYKCYIIYKESQKTVYTPFSIKEISVLVMSPQIPTIAAFQFRDHQKLSRSHIIFMNYNMGFLVRYLQELNMVDLRVEFKESFDMTVGSRPHMVKFQNINQVKKTNEVFQSLVVTLKQGYLLEKKINWFVADQWVTKFFVLTNAGILRFGGKSILTDTSLIQLSDLKAEFKVKAEGQEFVMKWTTKEQEIITLAAPDKRQFDLWKQILTSTLNQIKEKPKDYLIKFLI